MPRCQTLRTGLDQFDCGDEFGLIRAAVGAYSENGPDGAAINPRRVPLTREEFVSLRDGAKGLMHRIPSEHKARLIELGYIEEVFGGIRLTSAGRMRIAEG